MWPSNRHHRVRRMAGNFFAPRKDPIDPDRGRQDITDAKTLANLLK